MCRAVITFRLRHRKGGNKKTPVPALHVRTCKARTGATILSWYHLVLPNPRGPRPRMLRRGNVPRLQPDALTGVPVAGLALLCFARATLEPFSASCILPASTCPGSLVGTNANAYFFLHRLFRCCALSYTQDRFLSSPFLGQTQKNEKPPRRRARG